MHDKNLVAPGLKGTIVQTNTFSSLSTELKTKKKMGSVDKLQDQQGSMYGRIVFEHLGVHRKVINYFLCLQSSHGMPRETSQLVDHAD